MTVLTGDLLASFDDSVGPVDEARLLPPVQFNRWLVRRYREHWPSNGA